MTEIRVLTVRQPHAWAIIHGRKDVENRTRNIAGSYRGPVAIHASEKYHQGLIVSSPLTKAIDSAMEEAGGERHGEIYTWPIGLDHDPREWLANRGSIIGVVDLVDVHFDQADECFTYVGEDSLEYSEQYGCSPWSERGMWHLVLRNPRSLPEPIPWKGGPGLRMLDASLIPGLEALL